MESILSELNLGNVRRGIALEIQHETKPDSWYWLVAPKRHSKKWRFDPPLELSTGHQTLRFWDDSIVVLKLDINVPEECWTLTSFWKEPCDEEFGEPYPGLRVYTKPLEVLLLDTEAKY